MAQHTPTARQGLRPEQTSVHFIHFFLPSVGPYPARFRLRTVPSHTDSLGARYTTTEHPALATKYEDTEPMSMAVAPESPRLPTTSSSAPLVFTNEEITSRGSPGRDSTPAGSSRRAA